MITERSERISEFYETGDPVLSLEFFPPKTEEALPSTCHLIKELSELGPHFMTVTYGAGGGTRGFTRQLVSYIHQDLQRPAVAHLTCVGHSAEEIDAILDELRSCGISNVMALRGDAPKGTGAFQKHPDGFGSARELVSHIKERGDFCVAVAGYPEKHLEAASPEADLENLRLKVEAGAEVVMTQLFFSPDLYFQFIEKTDALGINVPIVPGIMPISDVAQLERFTSMCGASIPTALRSQLAEIASSKEDVVRFGTEYAIRLARKLVDGGAPGIHLYTLNNPGQARAVIEGIGIHDR